MFCGHCGKTIADGLTFCPFCGKAQAEAPAASPVQEAAPPTPAAPTKPGLCPSCGYQNNPNRTTCKRCHFALPAVARKQASGFAKVGCIIFAIVVAGLFAIGSIGASRSGTSGTPVAGAPSASPAPGKPAPTAAPRVGDVVTSGNWTYQITKLERGKTIRGDFNTTETAIGEWIVIYLTMKNVGTRNFPINTTDFKLRIPPNLEISPSSDSRSVARAQKLVPIGDTIPPGVGFDTVLLFDVAPGSVPRALYLDQARSEITLG